MEVWASISISICISTRIRISMSISEYVYVQVELPVAYREAGQAVASPPHAELGENRSPNESPEVAHLSPIRADHQRQRSEGAAASTLGCTSCDLGCTSCDLGCISCDLKCISCDLVRFALRLPGRAPRQDIPIGDRGVRRWQRDEALDR